MGLQIWLPLDGTLENKGMANVTITNTNATIDTSGKIGKCYSFNNNDSMIKIEGDLVSSMRTKTAFTIAFWLYSNDSGNRSIYFATNTGSSTYAFALEKTTGELLRFYWQASPDLNLSAFTIPNQEWVHITCVYKNNNAYFYKNGILTASQTGGTINTSALTNTWSYASLGRDYRTGATTLNGKMSDFRWYDHALSETLIKKLALGLVLHLPLNNRGLGNENLIINNSMAPISGTTSWSYAGTDWSISNVTSSGASRGHAIRATYAGTAQQAGGIHHPTGNTKGDLTNGAVYTLSARLRASKNCTVRFHNELQATNYINVTTNWKVYSYSSTINNDNTYHSNICYVAAAEATQNMWIECDWIKLEEGNKATPYSPNPADTIYPATGSGINENLFIATDMSEAITANSSTDWTKHFRMYNGSAAIHTIDTTEMTDTIALTTASSNLGIAFVRHNSEMNLDPTQYYTISCEAKCTNASLNLCIGLSYYNDQGAWVWRGGSNAKTFTAADTWQKITHTFKPDANTLAICYCFTINPGASPSGTDTFSIRKCKLEKGSVATDWQPSPVDASYKTLGYNNNIIYDQSGYCHNGIKYGDIFTNISGAPKYDVSTHFSNKNQYIKIPGLTTTGFGNSYSIAWWAKPTDINPMHWGFGDGIRLNGMYTGRLWNTGDSSNNPLYTPGTTTQVGNYTVNTWHHFVMTGDGTKCLVYMDGLLYALAKTYKAISGTTIYINGWDAGTSYKSNNFDICDFRLYATALSAQAVKSLYNNGAYIDANNNIYGKIRD